MLDSFSPGTLGSYQSLSALNAPTLPSSSTDTSSPLRNQTGWSRPPAATLSGLPRVRSLPSLPEATQEALPERATRPAGRIKDELDVYALMARDPAAARALLLEKPHWGLHLSRPQFHALFFGAKANPETAAMSRLERLRFETPLRLRLIDRFPARWEELALSSIEPVVWNKAFEVARHAPSEQFERVALELHTRHYIEALLQNPELLSGQTLRLARMMNKPDVMAVALGQMMLRARAAHAPSAPIF